MSGGEGEWIWISMVMRAILRTGIFVVVCEYEWKCPCSPLLMRLHLPDVKNLISLPAAFSLKRIVNTSQGSHFSVTYCFCLLYEYLVSLSLLSLLFLCSHLLLHRPTFPISLLMEITPWLALSSHHWRSQCSFNGNQSIISTLLLRGLVDAVLAFPHSRFCVTHGASCGPRCTLLGT